MVFHGMSISLKEFQQRRAALMQQLPPNSLVLVPAAHEQTRSRDTEYPFRQNSDFYYLTGFPEPEALLVLAPGREAGEALMFCRPRDRTMEIWNGYRAGPEGAVKDYQMAQAFELAALDEQLPLLMDGVDQIYYPVGHDAAFDQRVLGWLQSVRAKARAGAQAPEGLRALEPLLHEMRLRKSKAEIRLMQEAADISARAHTRAMQRCQPGMGEFQLEAELLHEFAIAGARYPAYSSIVGGGANGCVLHYVENSDPLRDGDLVLIDAGAEFEGYAADITRTFPVNGRFSEPQRALYELVLKAQAAAIRAVKPGNHWNQPHEAAVKVLTTGLCRLGLLQGKVDELIEQGAYQQFYMHRTGHWLGMDVHDVGAYKVEGSWRALEPGMVLTIEPGLYVAPDDESVDPGWRGIGIRIEDDVLVTAKGRKVLTGGVPKSVVDIEALMGRAQGRRPVRGVA